MSTSYSPNVIISLLLWRPTAVFPHMIQWYLLHLSVYYTFFVPVSMSPGLPRKATNSRGEVTHLPATNPKCWQVAEVSQVDWQSAKVAASVQVKLSSGLNDRIGPSVAVKERDRLSWQVLWMCLILCAQKCPLTWRCNPIMSKSVFASFSWSCIGKWN